MVCLNRYSSAAIVQAKLLPHCIKHSASLSNAGIAVDKLWGREILDGEITEQE